MPPDALRESTAALPTEVVISMPVEEKLSVRFVAPPVVKTKAPGVDAEDGDCITKVPVGEEEPMPTLPLLRIVSAVVEVVAKVDGEEVEKYRFPPAERKFHGAFVSDPSVSASCGPDADETVSCAGLGVVVPIPIAPPSGLRRSG